MQTKKFYGRTLKDATNKMKDELGDGAIIMGTRVLERVEDGINKKFFEIVSGFEEEQAEINELLTSKRNGSNESRETALKASFESMIKNQKKEASAIAKKTHSKQVDYAQLKKEIETAILTLKQKDVSKDVYDRVFNYLKKSKDFLTMDNLDDFVLTSLTSIIKTRDFAVEQRRAGKVISIIGPTGVGKTTCIAKLAAISKIIHNLDIGIISIDTYRLGAIDQLRIFSEISNVDMLVAYEPEDMPKLIDKLKNKDLIFIDTTGRSQRNQAELEKMKEFFTEIKVDETYLALSLTSATKNLFDAAERFEIFGYDSFVFTKIDEAVTHGNIVNLGFRYQKPVVYITNGQIIPDDILSADPDYIAKLVYNGYQI